MIEDHGAKSALCVCVSLDEREAVQKKTFTKWVNSHLSRVSCRITDLYMDLRDGRMLIKLLEVLSGERLVGALIVKGCFSLLSSSSSPGSGAWEGLDLTLLAICLT